MNFLDTDLYERQGKAVTNFALTLPAEQSNLAQAMTKELCMVGMKKILVLVMKLVFLR